MIGTNREVRAPKASRSCSCCTPLTVTGFMSRKASIRGCMAPGRQPLSLLSSVPNPAVKLHEYTHCCHSPVSGLLCCLHPVRWFLFSLLILYFGHLQHPPRVFSHVLATLYRNGIRV